MFIFLLNSSLKIIDISKLSFSFNILFSMIAKVSWLCFSTLKTISIFFPVSSIFSLLYKTKLTFKLYVNSTYLILSHRYWLDGIHTSVDIIYVSYFWDIYKEHIQNIQSYSYIVSIKAPHLRCLRWPRRQNFPAVFPPRTRRERGRRPRRGAGAGPSRVSAGVSQLTCWPAPPWHRHHQDITASGSTLVSPPHVWSSPAVLSG